MQNSTIYSLNPLSITELIQCNNFLPILVFMFTNMQSVELDSKTSFENSKTTAHSPTLTEPDKSQVAL